MENRRQRSVHVLTLVFCTAVIALSVLSTTVLCQEGARHDATAGPLILDKEGSFFVGGETIFSDGLLGQSIAGFNLPTSGNIKVNQMYVQYQIPEGSKLHVPIVMLHGGTLSGKQWEETPDGRMGWYEYFARRHRSVYVADQVLRGRSGFDQTAINDVARGLASINTLPNILRVSEEYSWTSFRFGPTFGVPFPNTQFPVEAADEFAKQSIPDFNATLAFLPTPDPTIARLNELATRLGGAVLMAHSATAFYPERSALTDSTNIRGIISIEAVCNTGLSQGQLAALAKVPILVVFGDHIEDSANWTTYFGLCEQFVSQVKNLGGDITLLHLPDAGVFGNSHLLMQDKNNLQVADLILQWIDERVEHHEPRE